jgi:3-hydroxyacyl-[acyl-carrier-protein] dehydratase
MSVDNARFRKPVFPGDTLYLHVDKLQNRRNAWKFIGRARVDGTVMAEATFAAMIMDG